MLRLVSTVTLSILAILLCSTRLQAAPSALQLEYDLLQKGAVIATVQEQLNVSDKHYRLRSVTQGKGIYKLMGERTLLSEGQIVKGRLRPDHFEIQQSNRPQKALISEFDWVNKTLHMQIKGEQSSAELSKNSQDLLSVMYCWMWQAPTGKQIALSVANGKKLAPHTFALSAEKAPLQVKAGVFEVLKLTDTEGGKTLYLAKDHGYLPVKIVLDDDGKHLEQILTAIHGQ